MSSAKRRSASGVLAVTTLSHMMQHIFVGSSILFPLIMYELNLNYTEFGVAIAVSSLIGGLFQIFFSIASRRVARYVLLGVGNVLLSFGTLLTSVAYSFVHFLNARIVANVGVSPQHTMGTAIISERFDGRSVGRAIGIHYGLAYIGNIVGPLSMTLLVAAFGWRNTLIALSVPALIAGLTVVWYLGTDVTPIELSKARSVSSLRSDISTLVKTKTLIPVVFSQALLSGGTDLGIITTYTPLFLANGLKLDVYGYAYGMIYTAGLIGGVIGPVLLGRSADRSGHLKMATLSSFLALILVYLLSIYDSATPILALHLFLLGLTSFSLPTLLQSHLVNITQSYNRDLAVGLFFTVGFSFSSLWAGVIGYIIDTCGSFTPAFLMMGTLGLAAFAVLTHQLREVR